MADDAQDPVAAQTVRDAVVPAAGNGEQVVQLDVGDPVEVAESRYPTSIGRTPARAGPPAKRSKSRRCVVSQRGAKSDAKLGAVPSTRNRGKNIHCLMDLMK